MELILSICAGIGAFFGSIAAHFIAHDAYSRCPKYAQKLIERAVRKLPPFERIRYEEEWLADLNEREGVFAKFKHACECMLCAHKVATTCSHRASGALEVTVQGASSETVKLDLVTGLVAIALMRETLQQSRRGKKLKSEDLQAINSFVKEKYRHLGNIDRCNFGALIEAMTKVRFGVSPSNSNGGSYSLGIRLNGRSVSMEDFLSEFDWPRE
jgi:hypothetical protein